MPLLNEHDGWPLPDREYAFGWLVLGLGKTREKAANLAAGATVKQIETWSLKQRQSLAGFSNMIERTLGPVRWDDPVI